MTVTFERAIRDLRHLHELVMSGDKVMESIRRSLIFNGCDLRSAVVFELFPDSGSTWIVRLVDKENSLMEFDIDISDGSSEMRNLHKENYRNRQSQIMFQAIELLRVERSDIS